MFNRLLIHLGISSCLYAFTVNLLAHGAAYKYYQFHPYVALGILGLNFLIWGMWEIFEVY